jgi:hypothetical protein
VVAALFALGLSACAVPQQVAASPDDLRDYRAFRFAAREGPRLACALRYLRRHPHGPWAAEVQAAFDVEEPAWFEAAQASRAKARTYLIDLPDGPHADAARALLVLFDTHQDDMDTLILLADARRTAALLDYETDRRKHLSEVILEEVAALLDAGTWARGATLDDPPPLLGAVLRAGPRRTWGGESRPQRLDQVFFVVPTPDGSQPREVDVELELVAIAGHIVDGRVRGEDLFVRWAESLLVRVLDPTDPDDRKTSAAAVADVLGGALEAYLPAARCTHRAEGTDIISRACDGWSVKVTMGERGGTEDVIDVRGPT